MRVKFCVFYSGFPLRLLVLLFDSFVCVAFCSAEGLSTRIVSISFLQISPVYQLFSLQPCRALLSSVFVLFFLRFRMAIMMRIILARQIWRILKFQERKFHPL